MEALTNNQLDELVQRLSGYSVALLGNGEDDSGQEILVFAGSGTLVGFEGRHYVLTAAHVWAEKLAKRQVNGVCFTVKPDSPGQRLCLPKDLVKPSHEALKKYRAVPSLDLCFLPLPPNTAARLEAYGGVFYNLGTKREYALATEPDLTRGYAITGCPEADATITEQYADLKMMTFLFPAGEYVQPDAASIDYWKFYDWSDPPRDYGGVSGGGVWSFRFDGDQLAVTLEGVAFYQDPPDRKRIVHCHGRKAIYCHLPGGGR